MKKLLVFLFVAVLALNTACLHVSASGYDAATENIPSAILIEASSGRVIYEKNADEKRHPASVTKIMTLLLVMEGIELGGISLDDTVSVSEKAASMGGSQIFLEAGEEMSVSDLIKAVTVCSANDAAVALAEHLAGSEDEFVALMNKRASELGMKNTHFENTNGLDDTTDTHLTSARDIALMSAELMSHEKILEYTTIWQDTVRNGEFTLTNTNKLIRFYKGANGLKTGFTSKSGYCISASAKRDGMQLIAVVMGAATSNVRNEAVKKLMDIGFATYAVKEYKAGVAGDVRVRGGEKNTCSVGYNSYTVLCEKKSGEGVVQEIDVDGALTAPVRRGDVVGKVYYKINGSVVGERDLYALEDVPKMKIWRLFSIFVKKYFLF